jgi:hypothetical protein
VVLLAADALATSVLLRKAMLKAVPLKIAVDARTARKDK